MVKIIRLLDKNKIPVKGLVNYSDLCVENTIDMNDKTLTFTSPLREVRGLISPECYIETRDDIFVVKEINLSTDGTVQVSAQLDMEELEGKSIHSFKSTEQTIDSALRLAFAGTGWTIEECTVTKKRTLSLTNVSALEVLKQAINTYMCEITIDSKAKTIRIYDKIGEDRGVYFTSQLNLKKLTVQSTSYDFYTEIEPYGKDGMTIEEVNDGKTYVENHQYSDKKKRYIWKDERYTIAENMKADAIEKLADMSKPYSSYSADIIDLSRASDKYSILSYELGDTVTLVDGITETREKQRIVGTKRYPNDPSKDTCTLANKVLTFDEMAQKYEQTSSTVDNITNDNGTIDGDTIDGIYTSQIYDLDSIEIPDIDLDNLEAQYVEISGKLTAVEADIGELNANISNIDQAVIGKLDADYAEITYAKITDLDAAHASIGNLEAETANIKSLLAGSAGIGDLQAINLSSANVNIADATITDAMIASLTASKITAGTIYTNRVTIQSGESDDSLWISGSVIQMSDQNRVRAQIGKDASGTYNFYIWDTNGNLMWNALGVTGNGLNDGIIVDKNVADNAAINGSKLDIQSVASHLMDDGTLVIDSSRVKINDQTLSAVYTTITQSVTALQNNVSTLQTSLNVVQGQISSKIWKSDIETATDELGNEITTLTDQYSAVVQTQNSLSAKISSLETTSTSHTSQIADLQVTVDGFSSTVQTAISEIQVGGRNFATRTNRGAEGWSWLLQDSTGSSVTSTTDSTGILCAKFTLGSASSSWYVISYRNIQPGKYDPNTDYTVSFDVLPSADEVHFDISFRETDNSDPLTNTVSSARIKINVWSKVTVVLHTLSTLPTSRNQVLYITGMNVKAGVSYTIKNLKIEKGNKATDWTPAPEDIDTKLEDYATVTSVESQIKQSYDSINLTLQQDYATKASLALQLNTNTGVATLAAAADRIELTSGQLVIKSGGLTLDANGNAVFKGQITSSAGSIGGWTINDSSISKSVTVSGETFTTTLYGAGQDKAIVIGQSDSEAQFTLYANGRAESMTQLVSKELVCSPLQEDWENSSPSAPFFIRCQYMGSYSVNSMALRFTSLDYSQYNCFAALSPYMDSAANINLGAASLPFYRIYGCDLYLGKRYLDGLDWKAINKFEVSDTGIFLRDSSIDNSENPIVFSVIRNSSGYSPGLLSLFDTGDGTDQILSFRVDPMANTLSMYNTTAKKRYIYLDAVTGAGTFHGILTCSLLTQTSDERLKKNIATLGTQESINFIMGLRPTRFEFKSENDDEVHAGFIAQEVSKLQSDLGVVIAEETELPPPEPDLQPENTISEEPQTEWTINYSAIIAPLVAVVQSQQEEINDLKQKVSALSA